MYYHITIHTLFRRPVFEDLEAARAVSRQLHEFVHQYEAWVLLPSHVQLLYNVDMLASLGVNIERLVQDFKVRSAKAVDPRLRINGWLWERGFEAKPVNTHDPIHTINRMLLTPVRDGNADSWQSWPYWGCDRVAA